MKEENQNLKTGHTTVLLQSSIDGLDIQKGDTFLDCTINGGGHSVLVAERFGKSVKIIGLDMDADALSRAKPKLEAAGGDFLLKQGNFRNLDTLLAELGISEVKRILFDLGWSMNQFEGSGRGFSFQTDEPLLMTFKKNPDESDITAEEILNNWAEESIADIIYGYAEEQFSRRIAKVVIAEREVNPIKTTAQLVEIVRKATPSFYHHRKTHFATKTFQALRIAVNDEMRALEEGMWKAYNTLAPGGRMAIISFHSIEDRMVKLFFRARHEQNGAVILTKKPIPPSIDEVKDNPRSRSAKLRILQKP